VHALVTGGAGFIGSHLADAYLARGWRVSVIDDLSTGKRENVDPRVELHEADLRSAGAAELVRSLRPDVISHHAAQMDVRRSVADPLFDAETNVLGSIALLQVAAELGVKRFIFASSGGAIYGEPDSVPQDERHPQRPVSPYGCAKAAVEHYLGYYASAFGLATVALRYANVYGPRQNPHGEAGVIAIFLDRMLRGEAVTIHGSGEQTRDYVFIDDVVAANLAVTDDTSLVGAFNVGTGVETSVNRICAMLAELVGTKAAPLHDPAKSGEQMRSVLDDGRLRTAASLPPHVPLPAGLARTADWFRAAGV
jgi:UDP-glucose 4-epimerase